MIKASLSQNSIKQLIQKAMDITYYPEIYHLLRKRPERKNASLLHQRNLFSSECKRTEIDSHLDYHNINDNGSRVVDTTTIARPIREKVREYTSMLRREGKRPPLLVGVMANDDPAAVAYTHSTTQTLQGDGIQYRLRSILDKDQIELTLSAINRDPHVTGIIVYYPIFKQRFQVTNRGPYKNVLHGVYYKSKDDYLRDLISPLHDVEGLCSAYNGRILHRDSEYVDDPAPTVSFIDYHEDECKFIFPCTALSVIKILQCFPSMYNSILPLGRRFENKTITILNRSEIFGRPLAALLSNDGAKVYSIDIDSILLFHNGRVKKMTKQISREECVKKSSAVITGVPSPLFLLPTEWIAEDSIVINVSSFLNIDEHRILDVPGVIYVPHVGKVTVATLEHNLVCLHKRHHRFFFFFHSLLVFGIPGAKYY